MESWTFGLAIFGAICGGIGAILGIINTAHSLLQTRVRLKVLPAYAVFTDRTHGLSVDVTNLSAFAITIKEVGFFLDDGKRGIAPFLSINEIPKRLEPRASVTTYFPASSMDSELIKHITSAFARTDCGITIKGTSPMLRQIIADQSL